MLLESSVDSSVPDCRRPSRSSPEHVSCCNKHSVRTLGYTSARMECSQSAGPQGHSPSALWSPNGVTSHTSWFPERPLSTFTAKRKGKDSLLTSDAGRKCGGRLSLPAVCTPHVTLHVVSRALRLAAHVHNGRMLSMVCVLSVQDSVEGSGVSTV